MPQLLRNTRRSVLSRRSRKRRTALVVTASVIVAPLLVAGGFFVSTRAISAYENSSQFACSRPPAAIHNVILDTSDPASDSQRSQIEQLFSVFLSASKAGDVTNVFVLTEDPLHPVKQLLTVCDSGTAAEHSIWDATPDAVNRRRALDFEGPIERVLSAALTLTPRTATPLVEALSHLASHPEFHGGIDNQPETVRLLVISDLLQHTDVSAYNGSLYSKQGCNYTRRYVAQLQGVAIHVGVINRPQFAQLQSEQHQRWFLAYLRSSGVDAPAKNYRLM